jgi:hypothetical protein
MNVANEKYREISDIVGRVEAPELINGSCRERQINGTKIEGVHCRVQWFS